MDDLACPACQQPLATRGRRLFCDTCAGVMVTRDELVAMLRDIDPDDTRALEQRLRPMPMPMPPTSRSCPRCASRMDAFRLNEIPIDQCFEHGFWFDRDELAGVLQGNTSPGMFRADHEQRQFAADSFELGALGAMLVRLFRALRERRRRNEPDPP